MASSISRIGRCSAVRLKQTCGASLVGPTNGSRPEIQVASDPAAGTGGFLIAADAYINKETDDLFMLNSKGQEFQRFDALLP